jgi:HlyD family secretion protein
MTKTMRGHVILVLGLGLCGCRAEEPSNTIRVSGQAEATEIQIAPEVGGRLLDVRVKEGDRVAAGDVVARLDTRDIELQIARVRAERAAAEAQFRVVAAARPPEEIRQAQAQVQAASAEAAAAQAEVDAAVVDLERFDALLKANAGSRKQRDDAQARVNVGRERQRSEERDAARARVTAVDAQIAILEKSLADANVTTSVGGIVTQTLADAGEVVVPRMPILVISDLDHAWANLFVPEPAMPRLKLGQAATITTDSGARMAGTVTYISPQAEFTPRNVQTADERSKLVYRIKVSVDNTAGVLKQGMPVDAELTLQ